MLTFSVLLLLYFLPAILAHNKRNFVAILALNFFLGWTIVGWLVALVWALSESEAPRMVVIAPPAGARFCCACGAPTHGAYCSHCGKAWA